MYLSSFEQFMKPDAYGRWSNFSGLKISTFQMFWDNLGWNLHLRMKHQCAEMLIFPWTGAILAWILPALRLGEINISIPSENRGCPYQVCKKRFSAIFTSADKNWKHANWKSRHSGWLLGKSLGKPRDAEQLPSWQNFQSAAHSH